MSFDFDPIQPPDLTLSDVRRLYIREPGWKLGHKVGSAREFCYMQSPGQDFYHRILDGEIYVYSADERLCLSCAGRRGLLSYEARGLRDRGEELDLSSAADRPASDSSDPEYDLRW